VWAAIFVAAGAPGGATWEEGAPGYSPVFMALALWAFWLLARAWLEPGFALTAAILLGISSPMYLVARMPLSEPIAAFFCLSGAAVLARSRMNPGRMDAILAGAAFGAAARPRRNDALRGFIRCGRRSDHRSGDDDSGHVDASADRPSAQRVDPAGDPL